jgi:predicted aspartyl protease
MTITVPLQIIDLQDGYHPLIEVAVYGKPFILVLDTGASKTAFDHVMLLQSGNDALIKASDKLTTGLGTNTMTSSTALISDMRIGDLQVATFEVAVLDLSSINIAYRQLDHPEVLGVLGGDILMKYKAVINYEKKTISFKK